MVYWEPPRERRKKEVSESVVMVSIARTPELEGGGERRKRMSDEIFVRVSRFKVSRFEMSDILSWSIAGYLVSKLLLGRYFRSVRG